MGPLAEHEARDWLRTLVDVRERGLREPLPLPLKTSLAFATDWSLLERGGQGDPDARAADEWTTPRFSDTGFPKEDADPWHVRAFGDAAPYSTLAAPLRSRGVGRTPPAGPLRLARLGPASLRPSRDPGGGVMDVFDITAPLPPGPTTTLLEASAGTGKTWTIAALVTRYVAEGVARLDELLVVTFTRAASQELRERVRAQLTTAATPWPTTRSHPPPTRWSPGSSTPTRPSERCGWHA